MNEASRLVHMRLTCALAATVLGIAVIVMSACAFATPAYAVTAAERHAEADAISQQINSLQSSLNEMQALHAEATAQYDEAIALRDEAALEIEAETAEIEKLQDQMASFAVSMYKQDGANTFLAVLLQTTSFHDFMMSLDRCSIIASAGTDLIDQQRQAQARLEESRATYDQQANRAEQQMEAAESAVRQIGDTQAALREEVDKLNAEAQQLEEQEKEEKDKHKEQKQELSAEEARKAEEDRKAKEAEIEKRAKEAADAAATAAAAAKAEVGAAVLMGSGYFTNPCPTSTNSSGFGYRDFDNAFHKGLDMAAPAGTPYYAADSGTVLYATNDGGYNGGAGNWIVIAHGDGIVTKYMHSLTTFVKPGDQVERGQNIGLVGNTGDSYGAHLHFQVEVDGVAVNPLNYI